VRQSWNSLERIDHFTLPYRGGVLCRFIAAKFELIGFFINHLPNSEIIQRQTRYSFLGPICPRSKDMLRKTILALFAIALAATLSPIRASARGGFGKAGLHGGGGGLHGGFGGGGFRGGFAGGSGWDGRGWRGGGWDGADRLMGL
jgi:hypothetical protein